MKYTFLLLFLAHSLLHAQLNRFPYVQSNAQNSSIIAWKTANNELGSVAYGLDINSLNDTVFETTSGERHAVTLNGLSPDTKYYYSVLGGSGVLASEYFTTALESIDSAFSFIHYGDCGYNSAVQAQLGALMEADDASFAVVCGDVDQGGVPHISESEGGDNYDDIYFDVYNNGTSTKMLSHECHYTSIGNHDIYADNGATYDLEFHLPHNNADSSERYYSFEWGDAKFIALDVITPFDPTPFPINFADINNRWWTDFRPGSPQYQFLESELQCNQKQWSFVYFHEGPWTNFWGVDYFIPSNVGGDYYLYDGNQMVRDYLVPLFEQYNVDFVLCGHSHLYEKAEKNGVTYITSGGAGSVGGNTMYANHPEIILSIIDNMYVKYLVDGNTTTFEVINKNNTVIDTYSKTKTYTEFNINATVSNTTCYAGNDGSISLNVVGPKPPYSIEWFDGDTNSVKSGLAAGDYYVYTSNAYNCQRIQTITVEEPNQLIPEILLSDTTGIFCADQSITLSTANTYSSYEWSNQNVTALNEVTTSGSNTVTVTDADGCVGVSAAVTVEALPLVDPFFLSANAANIYNFLCFDDNGIEYNWDFGDGTTAPNDSNLVQHTFTANGTYEVQLITSSLCNTDTATLTIIITTFPDTMVRVNDVVFESTISMYPNPTDAAFTVEARDYHGTMNIAVYTTTGQLISEMNTDSNSQIIETNNWTPGVYFVSVTNEDLERVVKRIIIQ